MAGQLWSVSADGGYLYGDELSSYLRIQTQALTKFRPLCDNFGDASEKGLHRGSLYQWDVVSDVGTQGRELAENDPMPETNSTITQGSLTVTEYGNSVPYTCKLEALSQIDVESLIDKSLKNDARKAFDIAAYLQFDATPLTVAPTGGTSTTAVTLETTGTCTVTNNVAMGADHVKAIVDVMMERNIPPHVDDDYVAISHQSTFRPVKNDMESIEQYTPNGIVRIFNGEIGRYEGTRFVVQNNIPKGGAVDSTTFDPWTRTADAWNNAKSSWAFFAGGDTVMEAIVIPEEIRAKIPGDYGRSKGIAWFYLGGFGLAHTDATNARIVKWDSAA